jgi:hypothetical protein
MWLHLLIHTPEGPMLGSAPFNLACALFCEPTSGKSKGVGRGTLEGCGLSFSSDTRVATPDGGRAIGTLKVGDKVIAYDPKTGKTSEQTVEYVWINHDNDLLDVTVANADTQRSHVSKVRSYREARHAGPAYDDMLENRATPETSASNAGEVVHTTEKHPWLTVDKGWLKAGELQIGEQVVRADGTHAVVITLHRRVGETADYYNLTVSWLHTYVVGAGRYVVHNSCPGDNLPKYVSRKDGGTGETWGRFIGSDGTESDLRSGHSERLFQLQPRNNLPDVVPGMEKGYGSWDHVEAHAASIMRDKGVQDGDLWINNPNGPCLGDVGCRTNLPHMLPEGATLRVHWPGGKDGAWVEETFTGKPDDTWIPWRP